MIKLDVNEHCQACTVFEPRITQRPEKLNIGFSDFCICGDQLSSASTGNAVMLCIVI